MVTWYNQVLHFKDNPAARAAEAAKKESKRQVQVLTEENKRLTQQVSHNTSGSAYALAFAHGLGSLLLEDGNQHQVYSRERMCCPIGHVR